LAENLIHLANDAGGRDNVSVLLVKASQSIKNRGLFDRLLGK
jgi:serine/threonine protein phosphatase PrpC